MVDYVDLHYASMLSSRVDSFKIRNRSPLKINFRCPVCGDSQKSKSKARGWILERDNKLFYYCHNCGASNTFLKFLKNIDPLLYNEYVAEQFINKDNKKEVTNSVPSCKPVFDTHPLKKIKKVSSLKPDHPVQQYIRKRQIPPSQHYRLYYAPKFKTWINSILPNKFPNFKNDEPRLILPFLDENGKMFGLSARGFDPNGLRYITIMFYDDRAKIFGLDKINFNKTYCIVEGAIDSLFLSNAVAMAGADGNTNGLKRLENAIFVYDAEPRNKEILKRMEKNISSGYRICIWPSDVRGKDINEMVLNGETDVEILIKENTYKGLQATLKLTEWRKI